MGRYSIDLTDVVKEQLNKHQKSGNKASINKISKIFFDLENTPYIGVEKPESLKHNLSGFWSREINKKDRIIYEVDEETVTVFLISAMRHYSDK